MAIDLTGLECVREGCGLPLFVRHVEGKGPMILHVHAATPLPGGKTELDLKQAGRAGCMTPLVTRPGIPFNQ